MKQLLVKLLFFNILLTTCTYGWLVPAHLEDSTNGTKDKRWSKFKTGWLSHKPRLERFLDSQSK